MVLNRPITTTLNYDDGNPLSGPADADLVSVTRYDLGGRVERTIDNYVNGVFTVTEPITDRVTLLQYDTLGRGITTTLTYDPLSGSGGALNRASVTAYDPASTRALGQRDPLGRWVSQQYDLLGRVSTTIQNCRDGGNDPVPSGCVAFDPDEPDRNVPTSMAYDTLSRTTIVTDALGVATRTTYDDLGRAIATTRNWVAGGPTTAITNVTTLTAYDGLGRTLVMTDALGYPTRSGYNGLSQTVIVTDTMGRVTRMGYDGMGTLRWSKRHDGQLTLYQLDGLGRAVATILNYDDGLVSGGEPADQDLISRTVYDTAGRRTRTIDPAGHATVFTYDNLDRLVAVTTNVVSGGCAAPPCNLQTQYQYDRMGNRTAIVDARSNLRRFAYDAVDRLVQSTDPLDHQNQWTYGGPVLEEQALANGKNLEFFYDGLLRPNLVFSLEWGANQETSYDALGRRLTSSRPGGAPDTTYQYDRLGHLTQSAVADIGTLNYGYDARGQRRALEYPNGGPTLEYAYWPDGQLKVVTDTTTLASYGYDTVGRLATVTRANGATSTYSYDDADRLIDLHTQVGGTTRSRYQYTLDRLGQRTAVTETLNLATRVITYAYDGLQRLSSAGESPGTLYAYGYDNAGNRTGVWVNGSQVLNQSYDAADQVVGYSYDDAGNLLDDGTHTYDYDPMGWVIQRDGTTYRYNADGVLTTETTGGTTISYTQDLAAPLSQVLQTLDGGTTTDHLYGLERLASESGGTRTWYGADALLSVRQTLNNSGTVLSSVNYDPWGTLESGTVPGFGFTGELQDSVGMVYLRARWYNPGEGIFTAYRWRTDESNDEIPYTHHGYAYALSDPILLTDPTGKFPENWSTVRALSSSIIDSATWHVKHATHDLHGFTPAVLATIMGATIAVEDNWGEELGRRVAGDVTQTDPSTGIANFKLSTAMGLLNAGNCEVPLKFNRAWRSAERLWPDQIIDVLSGQEPANSLPFSEKTDFSMTNVVDQAMVYDRLQFAELSVDLLAAHLIKGISEIAGAAITPSIFNVANYHWFSQPQTAQDLFAGSHPSSHGEGGVRIIRNFDHAAQVLDLSVRLTALPNGLHSYHNHVHPADRHPPEPFLQTEQDWANQYEKYVY